MNVAEHVFLALTTWREASNQSAKAQTAVACSILERVRHPGWWGHDVLGVIFKRFQYSSMTAPGDPNLLRWPAANDPSWLQCLQIADEVLNGVLDSPTPGADSYFDDSIEPPRWTLTARFCGKFGRLSFYEVGES